MVDIVISLHPQQLEVFKDQTRFKVVAAGRRWGKSRLAAWWLLIGALQSNDKDVFYVAPTFQQAKDIMWDMLKTLGKDVITQVLENTGVATLINGRRIYLKGSDRPETLRGVGLKRVVLDEYASMKPVVWEQILQPTLLDVKGEALFIGTPDGKNHFYELFLAAQNKPDWKTWTFKTVDNPYLDKSEIEAYRERMSHQSFRQEFEASFESFSGGLLQEGWIEYYDTDDFRMEDGRIYITVDLAGFDDISENAGSKYKRLDETAIAIVQVTDKGVWNVRDIQHGRWNVRETAIRILKACQKYHATTLGIEKGALKNAVMPYLEDTMRRLRCYPRLEELTHGGKKKTDRILWAIQGRFQHGKIRLEKSGDWVRVFKDQYNDFPNPLSHDDLLDALSYVDQIATVDYDLRWEPELWKPIDLVAGY